MQKAVDQIWKKHILISKEVFDEIEEMLKKNGWTEEEFENQMDEAA